MAQVSHNHQEHIRMKKYQIRERLMKIAEARTQRNLVAIKKREVYHCEILSCFIMITVQL